MIRSLVMKLRWLNRGRKPVFNSAPRLSVRGAGQASTQTHGGRLRGAAGARHRAYRSIGRAARVLPLPGASTGSGMFVRHAAGQRRSSGGAALRPRSAAARWPRSTNCPARSHPVPRPRVRRSHSDGTAAHGLPSSLPAHMRAGPSQANHVRWDDWPPVSAQFDRSTRRRPQPVFVGSSCVIQSSSGRRKLQKCPSRTLSRETYRRVISCY